MQHVDPGLPSKTGQPSFDKADTVGDDGRSHRPIAPWQPCGLPQQASGYQQTSSTTGGLGRVSDAAPSVDANTFSQSPSATTSLITERRKSQNA